MEAEAQCAYLDHTHQTHGTVTDDSDVFLFGGKRVYRHFFHQEREPTFYGVDDIESVLGVCIFICVPMCVHTCTCTWVYVYIHLYMHCVLLASIHHSHRILCAMYMYYTYTCV